MTGPPNRNRIEYNELEIWKGVSVLSSLGTEVNSRLPTLSSTKPQVRGPFAGLLSV